MKRTTARETPSIIAAASIAVSVMPKPDAPGDAGRLAAGAAAQKHRRDPSPAHRAAHVAPHSFLHAAPLCFIVLRVSFICTPSV